MKSKAIWNKQCNYKQASNYKQLWGERYVRMLETARDEEAKDFRESGELREYFEQLSSVATGATFVQRIQDDDNGTLDLFRRLRQSFDEE